MSFLWRSLFFLTIIYIGSVFAQNNTIPWTVKPLNPASFPLAIRNPYLNTWFSQAPEPQEGVQISSTWPVFWSNIVSTLDRPPHAIPMQLLDDICVDHWLARRHHS